MIIILRQTCSCYNFPWHPKLGCYTPWFIYTSTYCFIPFGGH